MKNLQNVIDEFNEAITDVAAVWQKQNGRFTDKKTVQFSENILRPISNAGARINNQADQLNTILKRLMELDLIP